MSYERTPDGGYAEASDATHSQPRFIGGLAMGLGIFAVLFGLLALVSSLTHAAVW